MTSNEVAESLKKELAILRPIVGIKMLKEEPEGIKNTKIKHFRECVHKLRKC